jgi:pilus assembly protein Flp/PilA
MRMFVTLQILLRDCRGGTAIEYGLILALVFLAMVGAVSTFGNEVTNLFSDVSTQSVSAMNGAV